MENTTVKKKNKKINVIDVVIVLLILALIGTAAYRIYTEVTKGTSTRQSNIIATFECQVEDEGIIKYLNSGETVYFVTNETILGSLYDTTPDDDLGAVYKKTTDGDPTANGNSGKPVLIGSLRLSADARKSQNGEYYVINGRNINVGSKIDIYTEKAVLKITIKSIESQNN